MPNIHYVYSSLAADVTYGSWRGGPNGLPRRGPTVTISGGAGVADRRLVTPLGKVTPVTEDELEILRADPVFRAHSEAGHLTVRSCKLDPEVAVAADMTARDKSAPDQPGDYAEGRAPLAGNRSGR